MATLVVLELTVMVVKVAPAPGPAETVMLAVPLIAPEVAVIVAVLLPVTPVARPPVLIVTAALFEDHVTLELIVIALHNH